jgi:hypothetical protein
MAVISIVLLVITLLMRRPRSRLIALVVYLAFSEFNLFVAEYAEKGGRAIAVVVDIIVIWVFWRMMDNRHRPSIKGNTTGNRQENQDPLDSDMFR